MIEQSRWVLDTNTLVSRLLVPKGNAGRAVDQALASGILLVSVETLEELVRVLNRPKFDAYVSREDRQRFISLLMGVTRVVSVAFHVQACRDPKDDMILDVALNGEADAIITGDQDLLVLNPFHDIPILSPSEFLGQEPR
jgi:putative PIN family toxin of toxin-antitoxin system